MRRRSTASLLARRLFCAARLFPEGRCAPTVSQITPKGDPTRKTFRVYLRLPQDTPLRIGMSVEVNIIFREKPSAIVVPAEAIAGDWVQMVDDGQDQACAHHRRHPRQPQYRDHRRHIEGRRTVLSPARRDLADGARIRIDNSLTRAVEAAAAN